ncbi:unnamed protein product, partial [Toxocara canis]|uniref:ULP_PROTEASE domain-containing protein n=1 Tax=Toxocara canis TaxID=6265 RepID=A0A183U8P8_TOXCA
MPRLKRKSGMQRAREAKEARRLGGKCVEGDPTSTENGNALSTIGGESFPTVRGTVKKGKRGKREKIKAVVDQERSGVVVDANTAGEVLTSMTPTGLALCDRLQKFAFKSPLAPPTPAPPPTAYLPDCIAEHVQLVQAIIGSEVGEPSLRDLLDPVGWLDAQTVFAYLESVAAGADISVAVVQPYIWMLRLANAEFIAPFSYVRHFIRNYVDDCELLLLPIVLPGHHVLGAYRRSTATFQYYDSLHNPISEETRAAVKDMLDVLHPGVDHIFVNSMEAVRQHDSSSCGVIVCFTALQLIAGLPTNHIPFDSNRFRTVIYNTLTAEREQRRASAVAHSAHATSTAARDTVPEGGTVVGNAEVTPCSTSRTRAGRKTAASIEGVATP